MSISIIVGPPKSGRTSAAIKRLCMNVEDKKMWFINCDDLHDSIIRTVRLFTPRIERIKGVRFYRAETLEDLLNIGFEEDPSVILIEQRYPRDYFQMKRLHAKYPDMDIVYTAQIPLKYCYEDFEHLHSRYLLDYGNSEYPTALCYKNQVKDKIQVFGGKVLLDEIPLEILRNK